MTSSDEAIWRPLFPSTFHERDPAFRSVLTDVLHTGLRQCGIIGLVGVLLYVGLSVLGFGSELHWTYWALEEAGKDGRVVLVGVLIVSAMSVFGLVLAQTECSLRVGRLFGLGAVLTTVAVATFEGALREGFNTEYIVSAYLLIVAIIPFYPPQVLGIGGAATGLVYLLGPGGLLWGGPVVPAPSIAMHLAFVGGAAVLITGASAALYRRHRAFGRSQAELQKSRDLLRRTQQVGQIGQVGGWEYRPGSDLVQGTDQLWCLLESEAEAELGLDAWLDFYPSEARQRVRVALRQALETGGTFDLEVPFTPAEGERRWGRIRGQAHRQEGHTVRVSGTLQDITELKSRERVLREERDRFETFFESLPTPVVRCTAEEEGILVADVNEAFEEVFGVDSALTEGKDIDTLLQPTEPQNGTAYTHGHVSEGGSHQMEVQCEAADGERNFQLQVASRQRQEGPPEVYAIYTDITERKESEQKLREREARLRGLANSIPGVVYQFFAQPDGVYGFHFVGDNAEDLLGISSQLDGFFERLARQVPTSYRKKLMARIGMAVERKESWNFEIPFEKPSGEQLWLHSTATPTQVADELVFNGVFLDITKRRRLEREVTAISDEVRRRIAEDLHDLLASRLAGMAMMARSSAKSMEKGNEVSPDRLHEVSDRIEEASKQARTLSHSLMPLEIQEGGLSAGLRKLADRQNIPGITCSFEAQGSVDQSEDVAAHLYRVGVEAVHNALHHAEPNRVDIRLRVEGEHLILTVEDDGVGIPEEMDSSDAHGLQLMRHRSSLIGAQLDIGPLEEGGTLVRCSLPTEKASQEPAEQREIPA